MKPHSLDDKWEALCHECEQAGIPVPERWRDWFRDQCKTLERAAAGVREREERRT